jgi:GNAT superfamily N-acetyltransferase
VKDSDGPSIVRLASQLGYTIGNTEVVERLRQITADENQKLSVCENQSGVVGWIHICGIHRLLSEPHAEITGFIVDEKYRSLGIGSLLLHHAEEWIRNRGYSIIRIRSNVIREQTTSYYMKRGYQLLKRQNVFVKSI